MLVCSGNEEAGLIISARLRMQREVFKFYMLYMSDTILYAILDIFFKVTIITV